MFALLCLFQFFSTKPGDWPGRTSQKWPILCLVGRKALTQSINLSMAQMKIALIQCMPATLIACWCMSGLRQ